MLLPAAAPAAGTHGQLSSHEKATSHGLYDASRQQHAAASSRQQQAAGRQQACSKQQHAYNDLFTFIYTHGVIAKPGTWLFPKSMHMVCPKNTHMVCPKRLHMVCPKNHFCEKLVCPKNVSVKK